jgi:hypothetical protein|tara:strand:- start:140 stop:715 length:576 start_codon:yes stop_codon:yes gene_type:complete
MTIPASIRAGDDVSWLTQATKDNFDNVLDASVYTLTYYLRTNTSLNGASVQAVPYDGGPNWLTTLSAATTASQTPGTWFYTAVLTGNSKTITIASGQFELLPSLTYSGNTPAAFNAKTQAEKDLDAVSAAIRSLIDGGAKQYSIGDRSFTKVDIPELIKRESQLKAITNREQRAQKVAQGLGDPHALHVRF